MNTMTLDTFALLKRGFAVTSCVVPGVDLQLEHPSYDHTDRRADRNSGDGISWDRDPAGVRAPTRRVYFV